MRAVHKDIPLPTLPLTYVVEHCNAARRLNDAAEAARIGAEFRKAKRETAIRQRAIFGSVETVHTGGVVTRRKFASARRRLGIILAPGTGHRFRLASVGGLQQREPEFAIGGSDFLRRWRQRRNAAIWRIHDHGSTPASTLHGNKLPVIGAGHVEFSAALHAFIAAKQLRARFVQFGALFVGEKFLAGVFGGALEGSGGFVRPDALQVRIAPRGPGDRRILRRRAGCGADDHHRYDWTRAATAKRSPHLAAPMHTC